MAIESASFSRSVPAALAASVVTAISSALAAPLERPARTLAPISSLADKANPAATMSAPVSAVLASMIEPPPACSATRPPKARMLATPIDVPALITMSPDGLLPLSINAPGAWVTLPRSARSCTDPPWLSKLVPASCTRSPWASRLTAPGWFESSVRLRSPARRRSANEAIRRLPTTDTAASCVALLLSRFKSVKLTEPWVSINPPPATLCSCSCSTWLASAARKRSASIAVLSVAAWPTPALASR